MNENLNQLIGIETYELLSVEDKEPRYSNSTTPVSLGNDEYSTSIPKYSVKEPKNGDRQRFRIHIGSQPKYYKEGDITFAECQKRHSIIMESVKVLFQSFNVRIRTTKKNTFSQSEWGLEPYTCIRFSCTKRLAKGLAAVLGIALKQAAVGIFTHDDEIPSHPMFTISTSDTPFTEREQIVLIKLITENCTHLSAQFDKSGENLEFHDFCNEKHHSISFDEIQTVINKYYEPKNLFLIKANRSRSELLEEKDYENAINEADLQVCGKMIKLTQASDDLYDKPQCN